MYLTSFFILLRSFINFLHASPENKNRRKTTRVFKILLPVIQMILPAIYLLQVSTNDEELDGLMIGLQAAWLIYWVFILIFILFFIDFY